MIFGIGGKYCPACRARMDVTETTHRAVDAELQPVVYHGVRHYTCPNGCETAMYDFRHAYIDDPDVGPRGWQPFASRQLEPEGPLAFMRRIDLSMWIVVAGLLAGYGMFAVSIVASQNSPVGKIVTALFLTLSALYTLSFLTRRASNEDDSAGDGSSDWGPPEGAH